MPRQSASSDPPVDPSVVGRPDGRQLVAAYSPAEWRLLTRLPGQVIVAATLIRSADNPWGADSDRTVGSGLAGLEGVAAGRAFDSDLVRAVVGGIYAESDEESPVRWQRPDWRVARADAFAACSAVARLLAGRADPADSAAYRQWVQSIAARVCRAARPDGLAAPDDVPVSAAERRFLDELGKALGLG